MVLFLTILLILSFYFISIALTASLQDVWYKDEFIIALSNIKVKKKASSSTETILAVKYKQTKTKMILVLDRRTKRGEPINSFRITISLIIRITKKVDSRRSSYTREPRR